MNNGLVIIYDPHSLYQFLWYYTSGHDEKKWTALCLPNGKKGEYMSKYCKRVGIFERVISSEDNFSEASLIAKGFLFFKMFFLYLVGKKKSFCKKIIGKHVVVDDFDEICILTDVGIISGAAVSLADEKEIVIFEDGIGDYAERSDRFYTKYLKNPYDVFGYLVAKMGYSNPGHYFALKGTEKCIKYSSHPNKMNYKKYKEINKLYDYTNTNMDVLKRLCSKVYPDIDTIDFMKYDAIIFTEAMNVFGVDYIEELKAYCRNINSKYDNLLVKKHPLDNNDYSAYGLKATVISNEIPGEVLIPYISDLSIEYMALSSMLMYTIAYVENVSFVYFRGIEEKTRDAGYLNYPSYGYFCDYIKNFSYNENQITII